MLKHPKPKKTIKGKNTVMDKKLIRMYSFAVTCHLNKDGAKWISLGRETVQQLRSNHREDDPPSHTHQLCFLQPQERRGRHLPQ